MEMLTLAIVNDGNSLAVQGFTAIGLVGELRSCSDNGAAGEKKKKKKYYVTISTVFLTCLLHSGLVPTSWLLFHNIEIMANRIALNKNDTSK